MNKFKFRASIALFLWAITSFYSCQLEKTSGRQVLVFSKTKGWVHTSIADGIKALRQLGRENGFRVDTTKDAAFFSDETLKKYDAVVFLSTTGDVLNAEQQAAFERYIQAGGGFVGIHSAACTEYEWPWFGNLMGAHFADHPHNPGVRKATVRVNEKNHPATAALPDEWVRDDEWYNYKFFYPGINVLASLDETTYVGGTHGDYHPIAWYQEFDGGRSFYTGGGHESEAFLEPLFLKHLLGGIQYAMGSGELNYSKATSIVTPEENRFVKKTLLSNLNSPMELAISEDGRVFFTELKGGLFVYDPKTATTDLVHQFQVETVGGTGLIGIAVDPDFVSNQHIYLYYAPLRTEEQLHFNLSRFTLNSSNVLDNNSEKILLQVPVSENSGSHHGGSLAWDRDRNLYLSTGGSTSPFASNGYSPLDERPGEAFYGLDEQRSSSNTNDLKGKILRIHPEDDGTYTIPSGNLFPPGTAKTLPEIYVMGCRNPYRITVNKRSGVVYWGDIGPDAGKDSIQGPKGYDEINQTREAGNYGWPYFIADNQAYAKWDFETQTAGPKFNPNSPVNNSPNNTGITNLPPAQPALIWYPYSPSKEFPELGEGGRSAMVGDFYHYDKQSIAESGFPEYYDNALFVFDWMRNWMMSLHFDSDENFQKVEPFMSLKGDFRRPIDLAFDNNGIMYLLEYGSVYGEDNEDARLVQITYNSGNRPPLAKAAVLDLVAEEKLHQSVFLTSELRTLPLRKTLAGAVPLSVAFTSRGSGDPDTDDDLKYEWQLSANETVSNSPNPTYTYTRPGIYSAILTVTDPSGLVATDTVKVIAGNAPPDVEIATPHNKSFYWEGKAFEYKVLVEDEEDGIINQDNIQVYFDYYPDPGVMDFPTNNSLHEMLPLGAVLISESDCSACHTVAKNAVGPSYTAIAQRYINNQNAIATLSKKIINGGSGNWGQSMMSAHPQLAADDVNEMVKYILSLADGETKSAVHPQGHLVFDRHSEEDPGVYTLTASYTDRGAEGIQELSGSDRIRLRKSRVRTAFADEHKGFERYRNSLGAGSNADYILFRQIDLTGIKKFVYELSSQENCTIVVRMDSRAGPVIAKTSFDATGNWDQLASTEAIIEEPVSGFHDVYFIVYRPEKPNIEFLNFQYISFQE